jgi:hypothetical protein
MGEAAIERQPTRKQMALARAALDPRLKTVTDVAKAAGMARSNASKALSHNATVQREIGRLKAEQADNARAVKQAAGALVAERLPTMQDAGVIASWKTAHEIVSTSTDEERAPDVSAWAAYKRRIWDVARRWERRHPQDVVVEAQGESAIIENP